MRTPAKSTPARSRTRALPAGRFSAWLTRTRRALAQGEGAKVPCGDCRACCTSSYFIHIAPTERRTLALIPKRMLVAAPGWPRGHKLLGYFENGHCPMFKGNRCSIYAQRPQTCRNYDCRLFAATGLAPGGRDKALINRRARRWAFAYPALRDRQQQAAVRAALRFLQANAWRLPAGAAPTSPSQLALLALELHDVFLPRRAAPGKTLLVLPDGKVIKAKVLSAKR